jgi:hypothetical protein
MFYPKILSGELAAPLHSQKVPIQTPVRAMRALFSGMLIDHPAQSADTVPTCPAPETRSCTHLG